MKGTKRSYRKIPKVNLMETKLSDIFKNNDSGVFKLVGAEQFSDNWLDNWLYEAKSIVLEKDLDYQIQFKDEGTFLVFYHALNL
ncbi:hypothetical protein [Clostridioides difficile]|uniref:hypothetical protein n=1 Tax=Clostridioides difficile TaxID=1496 RepID=UPI0021C882FA|nr:hypothetical protein [Clostridioides difficile]UUV16793.1 hypothetical protein NQ183_20510 [Clostridioides difficile]